MNTPEQDAQAQRELAELLRADTLRPEDRMALGAIAAAGSIDAAVEMIHEYYGNRARADRTPRGFLYLHFGMLMAACGRIRMTKSVLAAASGMLEASAEHLEPLAVGYGAEQMRSIARLLREAGGLSMASMAEIQQRDVRALKPCANCDGSGNLPDMSCCPICGGGGKVLGI